MAGPDLLGDASAARDPPAAEAVAALEFPVDWLVPLPPPRPAAAGPGAAPGAAGAPGSSVRRFAPGAAGRCGGWTKRVLTIVPVPEASRGGAAPGSAAGSAVGSSGEEVRAAQLRIRRLEHEMQELREAYAKKIANTELECEQLLRDKDDSSSEWYKDKKYEVAKIQAGVVVMQALFEKKRRRYWSQMETERADFERQRATFLAQVDQMKAQRQADIERATAEFKKTSGAFEARIEDLLKENCRLKQRCNSLEELLGESRGSGDQLTEANGALRREVEELRRRVVECERSEELARRSSQIEALEAELKRTKRTLLEKCRSETEALRKEIMEYVCFIVRLLPDEPKAQAACLGGRELPPELKARTANLRAPQPQAAAVAPRPPPHGGGIGTSPKALPPVPCGGAACGGLGGLRGAPPLVPPPPASPAAAVLGQRPRRGPLASATF